MSYKVLRWVLKLFLLTQIVSHAYALETKNRASSPDQQWKATQAKYDSVKQKQQQIAQANAAEANPAFWAGNYYLGDGLGENVLVALSDKAGVAVISHGDVGIYGASVGSVESLPNGRLMIKLEHPVMDFESGEYVPTKWGGRTYLIESNELAHFASDINLGLEPREARDNTYLLREGDEKLPATGLPVLPAKEAALIRNKPLLVHVTSVRLIQSQKRAYGCSRFYQVQIDHGSTAGLAKGVMLNSANDKEWKSITLTEVKPAQASASFEDYLGTCDRPGEVPARGDVYTTGSYPPTPKPKSNNQQCEKDQSLPAHAASAAPRPQ